MPSLPGPIVNAKGAGIDRNPNQDIHAFEPLIFRRTSSVKSQNPGIQAHCSANKTASNVNASRLQIMSDNYSIADSDISKPATPSGGKLRKKRTGRDGYESDGGYIHGKKTKKKENPGEGMDKKKKKSFIQVFNIMTNDIQSPMKDHETDGGANLSSSKSVRKVEKSDLKDPSSEIYETDGKIPKMRFFKFPLKSPKTMNTAFPNSIQKRSSAEKKDESVVLPLPIAQRFAAAWSPSPTESRPGRSSPPPVSGLQWSPMTHELTFTTSLPSPVSAGPSASNRPATASTSRSPSAFVTRPYPKNRDSHSSCSSSVSESNQYHKPQKRVPPSFFPSSPDLTHQHHQQQYGLRPTSSLSSLETSNPTVSLPTPQATSPTSADLLLSFVSGSPLHFSPTSRATSVAPLHINKIRPIKPRDSLSLPTPQHSSSPSVSSLSGLGSPRVPLTPPVPLLQSLPRARSSRIRPKNPPIDGFGPRSPPTPDSASTTGSSPVHSPGLTPATSISSSGRPSPRSSTKERPQQTSQRVIPSSHYIVPSPRRKTLRPPIPNVLAMHCHFDHIPPPPSPAPIGPLPSPPLSEDASPVEFNGNSGRKVVPFPSPAQLRQRMSKMKTRKSTQHNHGTGLGAQSGREYTFPLRPVLSPSQSIVPKRSVSVGAPGVGTCVEVHRYLDVERSDVEASADNIAKYRGKEIAAKARLASITTWVNDVVSDEKDKVEVENQKVLYQILDRFECRSNENDHSSSGEQALERSRSCMADKIPKGTTPYRPHHHHHFGSFDARPRQNNKVPVDVVAHDVYGFNEDGTVADRTSRWSESVYSQSSAEDETRIRAEAMLNEERVVQRETRGQTCILAQRVPDAYPSNIHSADTENAGADPKITPERSWNKF